MQFDSAELSHSFDPGERFGGAEQDAACASLRLAGDIQAIVTSIDKVNVSVAGRPKQDCVAESLTRGGVGCGVLLTKVGFHFHNPRGKNRTTVLSPHQDLAQKFARDTSGTAREKGTI